MFHRFNCLYARQVYINFHGWLNAEAPKRAPTTLLWQTYKVPPTHGRSFVFSNYYVTTKQLHCTSPHNSLIQSFYRVIAYKDGTHTRDSCALHRCPYVWYIYVARMNPTLTDVLHYSTSND